MDERLIWAGRLNELLEINFQIARIYRRTMEVSTDPSLKNYLLTQASKRSQFAIELNQEIKSLGGRAASYANTPRQPGFRTRSINVNEMMLLKNCIKKDKICLKKYKKTLSKVNDGSSREKLLRHKAAVREAIKELKIFKKQLTSDDNLMQESK